VKYGKYLRSSLHEEGMLFNYSTCGIINVSCENAVFECAAIRIISCHAVRLGSKAVGADSPNAEVGL